MILLGEAAEKGSFFSDRTTKRGEGKGRTTKKKKLFLKLEKDFFLNVTLVVEGV